MGFHLLSTEGKPITKLKIWTRKCSVCFRYVLIDNCQIEFVEMNHAFSVHSVGIRV